MKRKEMAIIAQGIAHKAADRQGTPMTKPD